MNTQTKPAYKPAYEVLSDLRIRTAKPVNGFVDFKLHVLKAERAGELAPQGELRDLGNGYLLVYGVGERHAGLPVDVCEDLAARAIAAGKIYRPAGVTPHAAERESDIFFA